ncbi:hypothetical protein K501DRAFT_275520, partial [Backusella circina FSU 941]
VIPAVESLNSKISSIIATSTHKPPVGSSLISSASSAAASIRSVVSEHMRASSSATASQVTAAAQTNSQPVANASLSLYDNYGLLAQLTIVVTIAIASVFAVLA